MRKKSIGKAHTLFDDQKIEPAHVWVLLAESCLEISRSLLHDNSYAKELDISFSSFEHRLGGLVLPLNGFIRHSTTLFENIQGHAEIKKIILHYSSAIRRVMVRVACEEYIEPLFYQEGDVERRHALLEQVRTKVRQSDLIGVGFEGLRSQRPQTYTPSRIDEKQRALEILRKNPRLFKLVDFLRV
jgi:hypothetical protein